MRIGTMFMGTIESLDGESIQTKFFILGVPLVPLSSYYVTSDRGVGGISGIEIPVHGRSVLLGYARFGLGLGALGAAIWAFANKHHYDASALDWLWPVLLTALWGWITFGTSGVPKSERLRRMVLKRYTGFAAEPQMLPLHLRSEISERLLAVWNETEVGRHRSWEKAAEAPVLELGSLLYAIAAYEGETALAKNIWERVLSNEGAPAAGPYR